MDEQYQERKWLLAKMPAIAFKTKIVTKSQQKDHAHVARA